MSYFRGNVQGAFDRVYAIDLQRKEQTASNLRRQYQENARLEILRKNQALTAQLLAKEKLAAARKKVDPVLGAATAAVGTVQAIGGLFGGGPRDTDGYSSNPRSAKLKLISSNREWPKTWRNDTQGNCHVSDKMTNWVVIPGGIVQQQSTGQLINVRGASPVRAGYTPGTVFPSPIPTPSSTAMPAPDGRPVTGQKPVTVQEPKSWLWGIGLLVAALAVAFGTGALKMGN